MGWLLGYCYAQGNSIKQHSELDPFYDLGGVGVDELHYQMVQWDAFAQAWDEIINDLREADLVSNKEVGTQHTSIRAQVTCCRLELLCAPGLSAERRAPVAGDACR